MKTIPVVYYYKNKLQNEIQPISLSFFQFQHLFYWKINKHCDDQQKYTILQKLNKQVAIKKITRVFKNQSTAKCALREIRITRELSHENIINSTDVLMRESGSGQDIYIVMDLMETDLLSVLKSNQTLNEKHFQYFFYQILKGLKVYSL